MITRTILTGIVVLFAGIATASPAEAASYQHIDLLALRIESNAARLHQEIGLHYQHTPHLAHLLSDTRDMHARARHIHELAHHCGSLRHIANDLRTLDRAFHHLEELITVIDHGHMGHCSSAHVRGLLNLIESDIHHLRRDIDVLMTTQHGHHSHHGSPVVIYPVPQPRIIVNQPRQRGVEIRSGWTRTLESIAGGRSNNSRRTR